MKSGVIYKVTNIINGKVYVGQTRNSMEYRMKQHLRSKDNVYFHRAIRKYGEDSFKWEVLVECPIKDLNAQESYWIKHWNSFSAEGYNLTNGGDVTEISYATKIKISNSLKNHKVTDITRNKISIAKTCTKASDATKVKLSKCNLGDKNPMYGKTFSTEHRRKMSNMQWKKDYTIYTFYNKKLNITENCDRYELQTKYKININNLFRTIKPRKTCNGWELIN